MPSLFESLRTSVVVMALRGLTLVSKFVLMVALTRALTPEEVGIYGLMAAAVSIGAYALGFEFSSYVARQVLTAESESQARMLRDQALFHLCSYVLFLPVFLGVFAGGLLPWGLAGWFLLLLVVSHLGLEFYRLLVLFSRPVVATAVLFANTGLWGLTAAAVLLWPEAVNGTEPALASVWWSWSLFGVISVAMGAWYLRHLPWTSTWRHSVSWPWIRKGMRVSLYFLGAGVFVKLASYLDIFLLQEFTRLELVGVFTFYMTLIRAVQALVQSGTSVIIMPRVLRAFKEGDMALYRHLMRRMTGAVMLTAASGIAGLWLFLDVVLWLTDKEIYAAHRDLMIYLMPALFVTCLLDVPHNALYVRHRDGTLLLAHGGMFLCSALFNLLLIPKFGIEGAALAALLTALAALAIKSGAAWMVRADGLQFAAALDNVPRKE